MKTNLTDREPLTPGTCEWCGDNAETADAACSLSCEAQLARLEAVQGRIVVRALKRWRKHYGKKGTPGEGMWAEITKITDRFLRTDRQRREEMGQARRAKKAAETKED